MKKVNKFYIFIIVLTFSASLIGMLILPNNFQMRFNLSSGFHDAKKWELFVVPFCSIVIYLFFIYIKNHYENKNDLMRTNITKWALYILPLIGLLVNINFIYEAYNLSIGSNNAILIAGNMVYIMNSILLIIIGISLYILTSKKEMKNLSTIICFFGTIGLIICLLLKADIIPIAYFVLIMLLVLSIIIYKIKFTKKTKREN